jgi:hypothetical protein
MNFNLNSERKVSVYLVVVVAGSEETNAEDRQVEKVADGGLDINAIPKEKTCNVTKFERDSFSSQDSLISKRCKRKQSRED